MKTAISLPDTTFERVTAAAQSLGISRSEFFARAAERWLADLEDHESTQTINNAIAGLPSSESEFTAAAARALLALGNTA